MSLKSYIEETDKVRNVCLTPEQEELKTYFKPRAEQFCMLMFGKIDDSTGLVSAIASMLMFTFLDGVAAECHFQNTNFSDRK